MQNPDNKKKKRTPKQIAALIGVLLLVSIYLITFIVGIFVPDESGNLFAASLVATFTIPLLVWICIWMFGKLTNKHTIADPDFLQQKSKETE